MADIPPDKVAILLPAELVAQMDELKQYRNEDRDKAVGAIIRGMCESYIRVREMQRWELEHQDELEEAYRLNPNGWDDAEVWEELNPPEQDEKT